MRHCAKRTGLKPNIRMNEPSTDKTLLAIDPGASGGFAWRSWGTVHACKMPDTDGEVLALLKDIRVMGIERLIIEDQTGVVGPNIRVAASSMFTFGRGFGFILGAAMALEFRVELVRPRNWQKALALGSKAAAGSPTEWKHKLKATAERLFPGMKITLRTADALLLLDYGTRPF